MFSSSECQRCYAAADHRPRSRLRVVRLSRGLGRDLGRLTAILTSRKQYRQTKRKTFPCIPAWYL